MARRFICDSGESITAEIETVDPIFVAALDHEKAEPVMRCALLMGLCALAEGGTWPMSVLEVMAAFMANMKSTISGPQRLDAVRCGAQTGNDGQDSSRESR